MFFGGQKQRRINSGCAAGHMIFDFGTILLNQSRCFPIKHTGGVIIEIMRQIGRNDDNRTGVGYIRFQNPRQFFGRNVAVNQRHDFEPAKNFLQKRQLHLQTVFLPVRVVQNADSGVGRDNPVRQLTINPYLAKRRFELIGRRCGNALESHTVRRTDKDDVFYSAGIVFQLQISLRGNRRRIDIAGMRHDQNFWARGSRPDFRRKIVLDLAVQLAEFGSVKIPATAGSLVLVISLSDI